MLDAVLHQLRYENKYNMTLQGTDGKIHNKFPLSAVVSPSIKTDTYLQKGGLNINFLKGNCSSGASAGINCILYTFSNSSHHFSVWKVINFFF